MTYNPNSNHLKTKKKYLAKTIAFTSLLIVSSAQATLINKHIFCPNGNSFSQVTQYEYINEPITVFQYLGGSDSAPIRSLSTLLQTGSWYSSLPFLGRFVPAQNENEYRSSTTVATGAGIFRYTPNYSIQIKDITPSGMFLSNGELNFFPSCQVNVSYL